MISRARMLLLFPSLSVVVDTVREAIRFMRYIVTLDISGTLVHISVTFV